MVFADSLTKAGRLIELQVLFARSPNRGRRTSELARRLGIPERTVRAYLAELSRTGRLPLYRDGREWRLTPGSCFDVPPVRFALEEAAAVYLAARLLVRHSDEPNPAVRGAIRRLAAVVPEDLAGFMDRLVERVTAAGEDSFSEIFRAMAYGWALRRTLEVTYHPRTREPFDCRFDPYLIEPSLRGLSFYAIGSADPPGALRVFKLDRVLRATVTADVFTPPPAAELLSQLDRSWGVWLSDSDCTAVTLRFSPSVARAVSEARWHASQRLETLADGAVEMHLAVASTVELAPWVLGWGAACEVIEPLELRRQVAEEHRLAAERYESAGILPHRR